VRGFGVLDATVIAGLGLFRRHVEQAARSIDVVGAGAAGEQAIVADAVEAVRQDVDQESADELTGGECHDLLTIAPLGAIVLASEGDIGAVAGDQPAVGDGDAVGMRVVDLDIGASRSDICAIRVATISAELEPATAG